MDKEMLSGQFLEQSTPDGEGMGRKDQYLLRQRTAVVGALSNIFSVRKERLQEIELQKAYVAAEAASKAKTDFLFNMSHDIRTPMNAIIGFTDLLEKHLDDKEKMLDYIDKIKTSNEFLLSLINNVLEVARIESGKERLDEAAENIHDFQQSVFVLFDSQMQQRKQM